MTGLENKSTDFKAKETNTMSFNPASLPAGNADKKAEKAILNEIEELIGVLLKDTHEKGKKGQISDKDIQTLLKQDPIKLSKIIKGLGNKDDAKKEKIVNKLLKLIKEDKSNLGSALVLSSALLDGDKETENRKATINKALGGLYKSVQSGDTSMDDIFNNPEVKEFLSDLTDQGSLKTVQQMEDALKSIINCKDKDADTKFVSDLYDALKYALVKGDTATIKNLTDPSYLKKLYNENSSTRQNDINALKQKEGVGQDKELTPKQALMLLAIDLQQVLANMYKSAADQSTAQSILTKAVCDNAVTACKAKCKSLEDELSKQEAAANNPLKMILMILVVLAAGALEAVTGGLSTPAIVAAIISVTVGIIMATPLGDKITSDIANGISGGDGSALGAQIGATAIIAVITTLLTLGASGFTTAAEGALEIGGEAVGETLAQDTGEDALKTGSKDVVEGTTQELELTTSTIADDTENSTVSEAENGIAKGAKAASKAAKKAEKAIEGAEEDLENAGNGVKNQGSAGRLRYDFGAFKAGFAKRFAGTLIQNILGSGILVQGAEAIMQTTDEGKKLLKDQKFMIFLSIMGAVVGMAGSVGVSGLRMNGKGFDGILAKGLEERETYLEENNLDSANLKFSGTVKNVFYAIDVVGQLAQAAVSFYTYAKQKEVAQAQVDLAKATADSDFQSNLMTMATNQQQSTNKANGKIIENAADNLKAALSMFGVEDQNIVAALN